MLKFFQFVLKLKQTMPFFDRKHLYDLLQYINKQMGVKQGVISEKSGIPVSTLNNIRTGRSGKKEYFDKLLTAFPEAIAAIENQPLAPTTEDTRQEIFQEALETAEKLAEIKMERRLRNLIPRLEAAENITEEELEALLLAYEVLRMPVPDRFKKK